MIERKGSIPIGCYGGDLGDPFSITVTGIPEVKCADWNSPYAHPYRVWTVQHGFDWRQHSTGYGGWALVTVDGWQANACREVWNKQRGGWDILPGTEVQLAVFRPVGNGERHTELDHLRFANEEQANDVIWAAGLRGLMIYDRALKTRHTVLPAAIEYENAEQAAGRLAAADRKTNPETRDWVYPTTRENPQS